MSGMARQLVTLLASTEADSALLAVRVHVTKNRCVQAEQKKSPLRQEDGPMAWLWNRSREMARDIWLVLRVRSFQLIVLQVSACGACAGAAMTVG